MDAFSNQKPCTKGFKFSILGHKIKGEETSETRVRTMTPLTHKQQCTHCLQSSVVKGYSSSCCYKGRTFVLDEFCDCSNCSC